MIYGQTMNKILFWMKKNYYLRKFVHKLDWILLSKLGHSKFIKSFNIWIVLVPFFAKLFERLPDHMDIILFKTKIPLTFQLPFNLTIFYCCSVFFGIASVIYSLRCPAVIKDYQDAGDFLAKNGTANTLLALSLKLDKSQIKKYKTQIDSLKKKESHVQLMNIYTSLAKDYKLSYGRIRVILISIYSIAFFLLLIVFVENTIVVLGRS